MDQLSPEGFTSRFTACSRSLWCIAAAILGDPVQADDVLQEAAVIALRKLNDFDPDTSFAAWMGQIVRYIALNHGRRRAHARTVHADPAHLGGVVARVEPEVPVTPAGSLRSDQASFDDAVVAALGALDETARQCLLLRTILDMPYREIARELDIPEGTAMSHVHRARQTLAARLQGRTPVETTS